MLRHVHEESILTYGRVIHQHVDSAEDIEGLVDD
jgi:hypothetical protein